MTMKTPEDEAEVASHDLLAVERELAIYVGFPKCMDCKWKLGTDITNHCSCNPNRDDKKHMAAFNRARELQSILSANSQAK